MKVEVGAREEAEAGEGKGAEIRKETKVKVDRGHRGHRKSGHRSSGSNFVDMPKIEHFF